MDLTAIPLEQFASNGVFAILFVWLLYSTRKEAIDRENKLTAQIEKQNEAQEKIVSSLERLETQIQNCLKLCGIWRIILL